MYKGGAYAGTTDKMRTVYLANLGGENSESKLTMDTTTLSTEKIAPAKTINRTSSIYGIELALSIQLGGFMSRQSDDKNQLMPILRNSSDSEDKDTNEGTCFMQL